MSASECPYAILGINLDATEDDVVKAHRRLILTHHPDKTDDPTATTTSMRLNDAKERALRIIAERKEQRQTEIDLDTHVLTLKQYIMQTVFEPIPIAADLQTKIRATVADCKGRAGRRSGPNPEIDAYYLYVKNLMGRIRMEEDESQNKMNKSNQRIADLQARLDAETAARERAEKVAEEKEHIIDALTVRLKKPELNSGNQENFMQDSSPINDTITRLHATLLHHEQTLTTLSNTLRGLSKNIEAPTHTTEDTRTLLPQKRKHVRIHTTEQTKNFIMRVTAFIQDHMEIAEGSTISSQSIKNAFERIEGQATNSKIFFKTLRLTLDNKLYANTIVRPVHHPSHGYRGLKLK